VGAGVVYDAAGGYEIVLWALALLSILSAVAVLLAEQSAVRMRLADPSVT
jgi:hypothetical protein